MSTLNENVVALAKQHRAVKASEVWGWACQHGWKNPHGSGGGGGWLAWCCVTVSWLVYLASGGRVTLAFDQKQRLALSRFLTGNASVPRVSDDARARGCATQHPLPGMAVVVEVRHKDKNGVLPAWKGKRCHIGVVVELICDKNGKVIGVRTFEGNLGGKAVYGFRRWLTPGVNARERVLEFIDMEKYAAQKSLFDLVRPELQPAKPAEPTPAPADDDTPDTEQDDQPLSDDVFTEGHEFEGEVADGDGRTLLMRCIACDADGGYQAIEIDAAGNMVGDRVYESHEWLATGVAHSTPDEG